MSRFLAAALAVLAALGASATAQARPFVVSTGGNKPSVAVDLAGTTHIVWDAVSNDSTSTTHYCRVARNGAKCLPGTERTFSPTPGDQDFGGPRVYLNGPKNVIVATARCCTSEEGTDQEFHETRLYAFTSSDGGATFGPASWIGTQVPDIGASFSGGAILALGIAEDGTALQSAPLGGFAPAARTITPRLADTGGVGVSPKGNVVAFADAQNNVFAGALQGDPNGATISFKQLGKGSDVVVTSGPKGADVFYKTTGKQSRYIVRRYANRKPGKISAVSEAGFPIFGTAVQDPVGRIHAAWLGDRGLTYRRSAKNGRGFARPRRVAKSANYFNLVIAANPKGRATIAYDSNGFRGRVGGFTVG